MPLRTDDLNEAIGYGRDVLAVPGSRRNPAAAVAQVFGRWRDVDIEIPPAGT